MAVDLYDFTFKINDLPLTTNAQTSMHWRAKGVYVKKWHHAVMATIGCHKPSSPLSLAKVVMVRVSTKQPDFDGLVSSFKPVLDGLIACGVLINDKFENIGQPTYGWDKAKTNKESCIIFRVKQIDTPHIATWKDELLS